MAKGNLGSTMYHFLHVGREDINGGGWRRLVVVMLVLSVLLLLSYLIGYLQNKESTGRGESKASASQVPLLFQNIQSNYEQSRATPNPLYSYYYAQKALTQLNTLNFLFRRSWLQLYLGQNYNALEIAISAQMKLALQYLQKAFSDSNFNFMTLYQTN